MQILTHQIEHVRVGDLTCHPRNPRRGNVQAIVESIRANGFTAPLIVQRSTGYVLAGNHRLRAAVSLDMTHVPVCWADVDDAAALRIMLADNRTADLGTYDIPALAAALKNVLADQDSLIGTCYDQCALSALLVLPETTAETNTPPTSGADNGQSKCWKCPACQQTFAA